MTPEYGAPSQLEKIDMLDYADLIAINKFGKRGRHGRPPRRAQASASQRRALDAADDELPVYGTIAARFNDIGVSALYHACSTPSAPPCLTRRHHRTAPSGHPPRREPASPRGARPHPLPSPTSARRCGATTPRRMTSCTRSPPAATLRHTRRRPRHRRRGHRARPREGRRSRPARPRRATRSTHGRTPASPTRATPSPTPSAARTSPNPSSRESLAGQHIPRVCVPTDDDEAGHRALLAQGERARVLPVHRGRLPAQAPGRRPQAHVRRRSGPDKTNRRFHLLCEGETAIVSSTAFDSVTLYGEDPATRPDIYGKIGESGVSVPHLDDMKKLYAGFDLCAPTTSVSMTINGPAPIVLAMFFNTAIDDHIARFEATEGRPASEEERARLTSEAIARCAAPSRPTSSRGPSPEHLHLQHRVRDEDDGRHPAVVRRPPRAQLLLGIDQRLPHR